MRKPLLAASVAVLLALPAAAATSEAYYAPPPPAVDSGEFFAGFGFGGFTSDHASLTNTGFAWVFRGGVNFYRYFGAELNYQGTSTFQNEFVNGVQFGGTSFTEQQITADLKLGYPFRVGYRNILRPYGFAGVGFAAITSATTTTPFGPLNEGAAAFPVGAGLSYNVTPAFVVDARYTYNFLTESIANTWNVLFNLGVNIGG